MKKLHNATRKIILIAVSCLTLVCATGYSELSEADSKLLVDNRLLLLLNGSTADYVSAKIGAKSESFGTDLEKNHILMLQNQLRFRAIAEKMGITTKPSESSKEPTLPEQNNALLKENKVIITAVLEKLGIAPAPAANMEGSLIAQNNALLKGNRAAMEKIAAAVDTK